MTMRPPPMTTLSRTFSLAFALGVLAGCGGDDPPASTAGTITVDSLNVALAGAFIPYESERRAAVLSAVANNPADIVCLQEVWREEDKRMIRTAAQARFPHAVSAQHNQDTMVNLDLDPMCTVPPEPTTAPCAGAAVRMTFESGLRCLAQNCSTMPGNEMGQTTSTACARMRCFGDVSALLFGDAEGKRCYGCVAPNLPTETFASIRSLCTTNPRGDLAYGGQSGVMILSRHPLTNTEVKVIPGTWNRRAILRATATIPGRGAVQVYCNHLTPVFDDVAFPYTGRHGCGMTDRAGWATEQAAQARALVSYVTQSAGNGRAIILGDFNTGPDVAGAQPITGEAPDTYVYLRSQLTPALPANHQAFCTYCRENPITGATDSVWIDHIFLRGFPAGATRSFARTYADTPVTVTGTPNRVPISDHYGVRAVVSLAP